MTESYFVKNPFGDYRSSGVGEVNSVIARPEIVASDCAARLRSYYRKSISVEIKNLVEKSLDDGARVVTFEVGCILQLSLEHADASEINLLATAIKEKCMGIYWRNVRSFLILHIDPRYHDVIPL